MILAAPAGLPLHLYRDIRNHVVVGIRSWLMCPPGFDAKRFKRLENEIRDLELYMVLKSIYDDSKPVALSLEGKSVQVKPFLHCLLLDAVEAWKRLHVSIYCYLLEPQDKKKKMFYSFLTL